MINATENEVEVFAALRLQACSIPCAGNGGSVLAVPALQDRNLCCAGNGGTALAAQRRKARIVKPLTAGDVISDAKMVRA